MIPCLLPLRLAFEDRNLFVGLQDRHAEVADAAQGEAAEDFEFAGQLLEDIVHAVQAVGAAHGEDQVAQDFPVVAGFAG